MKKRFYKKKKKSGGSIIHDLVWSIEHSNEATRFPLVELSNALSKLPFI